MVDQRRNVSGLLAHDLGGGVFEYPRTVFTRLKLGSDKVFNRLRYSPDARIPFSRCAKQLHNLRREGRGIEERPALVKDGDAGLSCLAGSARSHGICDQHAHRGFQARIRAQSLNIEEEPVVVEPHGRLAVEQFRVDSFFAGPLS